MIKAVPLTLGLVVVLAAAPAAFAQIATPTAAEQEAVDQAVHNEANRILLRQKLVAARSAQVRHELVAAANLCDEC